MFVETCLTPATSSRCNWTQNGSTHIIDAWCQKLFSGKSDFYTSAENFCLDDWPSLSSKTSVGDNLSDLTYTKSTLTNKNTLFSMASHACVMCVMCHVQLFLLQLKSYVHSTSDLRCSAKWSWRLVCPHATQINELKHENVFTQDEEARCSKLVIYRYKYLIFLLQRFIISQSLWWSFSKLVLMTTCMKPFILNRYWQTIIHPSGWYRMHLPSVSCESAVRSAYSRKL